MIRVLRKIHSKTLVSTMVVQKPRNSVSFDSPTEVPEETPASSMVSRWCDRISCFRSILQYFVVFRFRPHLLLGKRFLGKLVLGKLFLGKSFVSPVFGSEGD